MSVLVLQGKISICRSQGPGGNSVRIEVMDENSRVTFLSLRLSLEQYAEAITGLSLRPCEMELRGLDVVGMTLEHKVAEVDFPRVLGERREAERARAAEVIAALEVDGWRGRPDDLLNWHNRINGTDRFQVHFDRHVAAPAENR